ncbi:MAG: hypothetical protein QNJ31_06535 [Candidatus Caenarcaniphilales bacterium]|nr:hypothetical protein [Candidatus Caenarcaniphilales bacterium]
MKLYAPSADSIVDPFHRSLTANLKTLMAGEQSYSLPDQLLVATGDYEKAFNIEINNPHQHVTVVPSQKVSQWLAYRGLTLEEGKVIKGSVENK